MINGIGSAGKGHVGLVRSDAAKRGSVGATTSSSSGTVNEAGKPTNSAAVLASLGAPIDSAKIAEIRSAIAEGRYPVNPEAIAEKMIALDLPLKF